MKSFGWLMLLACGRLDFAFCLSQLRAAVIVPGFLSGSDTFEPLAELLTLQYGIRTTVVPLKVWEWVPCLGGRSVRPILERIHATVMHVASGQTGAPIFEYGLSDWLRDVRDTPGGFLKVGGTDVIDDYPVVEPAGVFPCLESSQVQGQIAIIGHSAGGWIARIYCSDRSYGGRNYEGSRFVHSLVTLGTPHAVAPGPAFGGIAWCGNENRVRRRLAVAGSGFAADAWGTLTQNSYAFCGFPEADGDGISPIRSALAWDGAELCEIPNTTHFPWSDTFGAALVAPELTKDHELNDRPWYGSRNVVDQWAKWLVDID